MYFLSLNLIFKEGKAGSEVAELRLVGGVGRDEMGSGYADERFGVLQEHQEGLNGRNEDGRGVGIRWDSGIDERVEGLDEEGDGDGSVLEGAQSPDLSISLGNRDRVDLDDFEVSEDATRNSLKKKPGFSIGTSSGRGATPLKTKYSHRATLKEIINYRAHLDSVREIDLINGRTTLISTGDDSLIKAFDLTEPLKLSKAGKIEKLENSLFTATNTSKRRSSQSGKQNTPNYLNQIASETEDAFPVFTISGRDSDSLFVTGGAEAVLRLWEHQATHEDPQIKQLDGSIELEEVIWSARLHPKENCVITSSADSSLRSYGFIDNPEHGDGPYFSETNNGVSFDLKDSIPTALSWSRQRPTTFASGCHQEPKLVLFDVNSSHQILEVEYKSNRVSQVNKICCDRSSSQFYAACEDGFVRVFDPRAGEVAVEWAGHSECATGICVSGDSLTLGSCGHDGVVKIWDLRRTELVGEKRAHLRKYDEVINDLKILEAANLVLSAGADGSVLFHSIG